MMSSIDSTLRESNDHSQKANGNDQQKAKRKQTIQGMVHAPNSPDSAFVKLRHLVASYSSSEETLMDIIKSRSFMQKIKSKHRVSETLVIDKKDFFELINSILAVCGPNKDTGQVDKMAKFNSEQVREIE